MHSGKLKAMLQYAQEAKLRPLGITADLSPLLTVLKDLGFAKQRFDSTVDPAGKLALLLLPVTTVCAIVASDMRNTKERRGYAERAISFLRTKFATALGISADWGIVWEVLLRLFDVGDHDIAASSDQLEAHIGLLRALFLQGGVFDTRTWGVPMAATGGLNLAPAVVHCMGEAGVTGCFITEHVGKQVARQCEFNVAGKPVALWGPLSNAAKTELGERLQNATAVGIDRLEADLLGKSHLRRHLRCFHIPLIQKVFGPSVSDQVPLETQELRRGFRELWQMLKLPFEFLDAATDEYASLASKFARWALPGKKLYGKTNRQVWSRCLDSDYMAKMCITNGRPAPFQHLFPVVRLYISILDGTVGVERDHALIRRFDNETHRHDALALTEDVLIVRCSKTRLDDMATVEGVCRGELGDFGLACAKLWREVLGARLGIGRSIFKGDAIFKGRCAAKKAQGFKHIKKGVLKAAGLVARFSDHSVRLGLGRGHANGGQQPGARKNKFWNPQFTA
jgi:hypothetical protein